MGLGKTVQTIALFALLKEKKVPNQLYLIVCPSTSNTLLTSYHSPIISNTNILK